jgi:hypothetical protein
MNGTFCMLPKQYRVLLIVPESGLGVIPEVDAMFDMGYTPQVVQGPVTRERLFQVIRSRSFDIIHYAGHASRDGIQLSDGLLDGSALVQIAKNVNAQLVFLNGCDTVELGQMLVDEHVQTVICTLSSVSDVVARETSQLFYKAFAQTGDMRAAYNMSKPPIKGGYSILTNGINDISLAPILEKMVVFGDFMTRNDKEHCDIVGSIEVNRVEREKQFNNMTTIFQKSRIWNASIMLIGMVGVGIIGVMFSLISRGAI